MPPVNLLRHVPIKNLKRGRLLGYGLFFLFLSGPVKAADPDGWESVPVFQGARHAVSHLEGTLELDGSLDEEAWKKAAPMRFPRGRESADEAVEVRFLSGPEGLFIGARLAAPPGGPVARATKAGGLVWRDQALEVRLKSPSGQDLIKLIVNANGAFYTEKGGKRLDGKMLAAATRKESSSSQSFWETELFIPWKDLGVAGAVTTLLPVQLRYLRPDNAGYLALVSTDDAAQWPLLEITDGNETVTPLVEKFFFPDASAPEGMDVGVRLHNQSAQAVQVSVRVLDGKDPSRILREQKCDLPGDGHAEIVLAVPSPGAQPRPYILQVRQIGPTAPSLNQFDLRRTVAQQPRIRIQLDRERIWAGDQKVSGRILLPPTPGSKKISAKLSLWDPSRRVIERKMEISGSSGARPFELDVPGLSEGEYFLSCELDDGTQFTKALPVGRMMREPERQRIGLKADWPSAGQMDAEWPLYAGVSFPPGTLIKEDQVRVVTESGREIPCQSEILARWGPGGSIKWLGLRFNGRPGIVYQAEFGTQVRRSEIPGPRVSITKSQDGYTISTGAAKFEMPAKGPLISRIECNGRPVVENRKGMLLVRDQKGVTATEVGGTPDEAPRIETEGKLQTIIRREGALRAEDGRVLGRYVVRLTFSAGLGVVLVQHTFVMAQSSNAMQIAELSFRLSPAFPGPMQMAFDVDGEDGRKPWKTFASPGATQAAYWMFQETFPHHRQAESRFIVGHDTREELKGEKAGESVAVWNQAVGVGLTIPNLARLFPKELTVGDGEVAAKLWSSRGGRLLDYRAPAIADYIGDEWLNLRYPGGAKAFRALTGESMGTARTHDLVLFVFNADGKALQRAETLGETAAMPPWVCQDPSWLQQTLAMGPIQAYDPKQFPRAEAFLRQFFRQCLLGQSERFGDYGFLDYGAGPHSYTSAGMQKDTGDDWPRLNYRYSDMDYGMRTSIWLAYARSGERDYRSYAEALNRHLYDFKFSHLKTPGRPFGAELNGFGSEDNMLYWTGKAFRVPGSGGHQGFDVENHLYQYYLTGDRMARDVALNFGEYLKVAYDPSVLPNIGATSSNYRPYGCAAILYGQTWDPAYVKLVQESRQRLVDLRTITGLVNQEYYGVFYKQEARGWAIWKDYEVTGSHEAGDAIVRLADYKVRDEPTHTAAYQDHWSAFFQVAHERTGEQRFADWVNTRLMRLAYAFTTPEGLLKGRPYEGPHSSNVIQAVAYGLNLVARTRDQIRPRPLFSQIGRARNAWLALEKSDNFPLELELFAGRDSDLTMGSLADPARAGWMAGYVGPLAVHWQPTAPTLRLNGLGDSYARTTLPVEMLGGTYQLTHPTALLSSNGGRVSLVAPDGLFYDAAQVHAAPLWFSVPEGSSGTLTVNRPAQLHREGKIADLPPGSPFPIQGSDHGETCAVTTDSGVIFVRLEGNLPPVFARAKENLFVPPGLSFSAPVAEQDTETDPFGPGSGEAENDKAVRLSHRTLEIPRGQAIEPGVFEFFDTRQGTLEFWFKPSWSSALLAGPKESALVSMGKWRLYLKVGQEDRVTGKPELAALLKTHLECIVEPETLPATSQRLINPHDLWRDTWHHIALCWDTRPDAGWVSELFVDGEPALDWNREGIMSRFRSGQKQEDLSAWKPAAPAEKILFPGTLDGRVDQIRISNVCRYHKAFVPPAPGSLRPDKNSLLFFSLDGDLQGVGPDGNPSATGNFR